MTGLRVGALISIGLAAAAFVLPVSGQDSAPQTKAVLELFTSQGCSSCPKADALFAELQERDDLVTLAYHVDYWDYIGWPDTFGSAANSDLQRRYADSWGSARIYTPQLVVNGAEAVVGSKREKVELALANASLPLAVTLTTTGGVLDVAIEGQAGLPDAVVWLVTYRDAAEVTIERGENAGTSILYTQIVTGRQVVAMWEAGVGAHFKLPLTEVLTGESNGAAILVQQDRHGMPGPILGAAAFEM